MEARDAGKNDKGPLKRTIRTRLSGYIMAEVLVTTGWDWGLPADVGNGQRRL